MRSDDGLPSFSEDMPPVLVDRSLALTRTATIKARDYWLRLRGDRAMPVREDIQPREMRDFLPYIGLVEMVSLPGGDEDYAMRLTGGRIEEIFGPLSGMPLSQALPTEIAARWRLIFEEVRTAKAPLAVTSRVAFNNQRHLKQELFIAPLGENGTVRMMFGALDIWPVT